MSENDPHDVLDYYGARIPLGIAENAYHRYAGNRIKAHPKKVASLRESDGETLGDVVFDFYKVQQEDGVLVQGMNDDRWALTDDIVTTCVARLVKTTDLVVVDGDDEYLPPLERGEDDDVEGPWASWVKADKSKRQTAPPMGYDFE